ncbi:hypothetical protein DID78_01280 [Candidatus Marinamargulisbacteria bacterium SCGC AG-343-D04]|nr:hypothetical protein DID78_01280 [Candidatus Marinamargulisbacteria bacterium SCGC AG-343-D04]
MTDGKINIERYTDEISKLMMSINFETIKVAASNIRQRMEAGGQIFFAGNGGSLAISHHAACDMGKGLYRFYKEKLRVRSLGVNAALTSALANDFGYENIFSAEYQMVRSNSIVNSNSNDVVICISSSGNSDNILNLATTAKDDGTMVIGLSGFSGGKLKDNCDISVHVSAENYLMIELAHQHILDLIFLELWVNE